MILLQYGMQGSASSWVFNVLKLLAESEGSDQETLLQVSGAGKVAWRKLEGARLDGNKKRANYKPFNLQSIGEQLKGDDYLVLKTHSDFPINCLDLLIEGKLKAFCTSRDLIDAAYSIYKKGEKARRLGKKEFSHVSTIEHALQIVRGDYLKAKTYFGLPNVINIDFDEIKNHPELLTCKIMEFVGVEFNESLVERCVALTPSNYNKGLSGEGRQNIPDELVKEFYKNLPI
ncbi:hypothetical protein E5672_16915 [Alteromonas portus]|uniref:Sulfotransferase domain-containing protein n=1 Tax=Alteromonas portus TaxID=2565549 RepID=A0A4U0ZEZ7_9ALTE|nr:sulfotransferase domain-containing protein [Alteromonas portus]TKB01490.1 hypothetical protein E5672_16915 [Alteromonas portus]